MQSTTIKPHTSIPYQLKGLLNGILPILGIVGRMGSSSAPWIYFAVDNGKLIICDVEAADRVDRSYIWLSRDCEEFAGRESLSWFR